ncbi:glycosyltransferase family 4 protein [Agilicoccus flavus]|uniref:glycosyltransferase family 4 protein n=1 Tax=Agilicoccus flavus TaxID=2775968 RepID=UPI0027DA641F|nr:glycosyltransferase family 4 protein [Agilicoccus flavus]
MRVGLVCPYSLDVPGGVQFHVRDLAVHLRGLGHEVAVLAPAADEAPLPDYVTPAGRSVPVPYNGSVARLTFGPVTAARVSRWVDAHDFDVLHLHEPLVPSVSILALWAARSPVVATFHTSLERSRALQAAYPLVRASLEKIHGRIAVSEAARETVVTHVGADAVVIPNGVDVARFAGAAPDPRFVGSPAAPTLVFLGRIDEPRKGLPVLAAALPAVLAARPGARVLVAGHGDVEAARATLPPAAARAVTFLGAVSEPEKASLLASADLFVAPHTGGESFGIVLPEAMAAGAPVVAADLDAFVDVLDGGRAGQLFPRGDEAALADVILDLLEHPARREALAAAGRAWAWRYDWSRVVGDVVLAYETVLAAEQAGAAVSAGAAAGEGAQGAGGAGASADRATARAGEGRPPAAPGAGSSPAPTPPTARRAARLAAGRRARRPVRLLPDRSSRASRGVWRRPGEGDGS